MNFDFYIRKIRRTGIPTAALIVTCIACVSRPPFEEFPYRKFYAHDKASHAVNIFTHPIDEDLLKIYKEEVESLVPEAESDNDIAYKKMSKVFAEKNKKVFSNALHALDDSLTLPESPINFSHAMAESLRSEMIYHKIVGAHEFEHYQSQDIGFCFGRATFAHLRLSQLNIPQNHIAKIFAIGSLRYQDQMWKYHMATIVMGNSTDTKAKQKRVWWVIDSLFPQVMELEEWTAAVEKLSILYPSPDLRFYISDPRKFTASSGEYQKTSLEHPEYKGYFVKLLDSL